MQVAGRISGITQPDQGVFQAIGYHILHGKILYGQVFDHKPPAIFLLNAFYFITGGNTENAVNYWILFFAFLQTFIYYKLCILIFHNKLYAWFGTALFILVFFGKEIFGTGNFSEQYATLCASAGIFFLLKFRESQQNKYLFFTCLLFGLAPWFKEPFALSAIPAFVYILILFIKKNISGKQFFLAASGAILPAILFLGWIYFFASWSGFLENLSFSRGYATARETSIWQHLWFNRNGFFYSLFGNVTLSFLFFIPGIISFFSGRWNKTIALLIVGQQILDWIATGMPGNWFAHYFLQTTPLSVMVITMGIVCLSEWLAKYFRFSVFAILASAICILCAYQWQSWASWKWNPEKTYFDAIERYLDKNEPAKPRNISLASHDLGFYLAKVAGISNMRYVVPYPYHWIQLKGEEKNIRCKEDSLILVKNPPEYFIYNGECATFFQDGHMDSIVLNNYHEVVRTELGDNRRAILLKKNRHKK